MRALEANPAVSPWLKNPDPLVAAARAASRARPASGSPRRWGGPSEGLWSSAAAAFEMLSADPVAGRWPTATSGSAGSGWPTTPRPSRPCGGTSRGSATTTEAVDLEALCQQIAPPGRRRPGRARPVDLAAPRPQGAARTPCKADPTVHAEEPGPIDPEDPESPEVDQFALLDRPEVDAGDPSLKVDDIPRIVGRVFVGQEIVALETFDDGRLDRLAERFTALAGAGDPPGAPEDQGGRQGAPNPARPDRGSGSSPRGSTRSQSRRLNREQGAA